MIQPQFGASMIVWVSPQWKNENAVYALQQAAKAGFDLIELCLPPSMDIDVAQIKAAQKNFPIQITCGHNLPAFAHIPAHPREALQLLEKAIERTAALGSHYLGGVLHGAIGVFTGHARTPQETDTIVNVWGEAALKAQRKGITIGIEPVNRYESYVCTCAAEVMDITAQTGMDNLVLHLDTFHMNIEEDDFYQPVQHAANRLQYLHMTDSNRGMLGTANVHWDDLFHALNDIHYSHPLVLENFTSQVPGIRAATSLWRDSPWDADTLARGSLAFMKKMVAKHSK